MAIVVDVANVMGSRPDGWWRDRAGAAVRLHGELVRLAESGRAVLPGETADSGRPGFVMVLEGAARAAATRISPDGAAATRISPDGAAASRISPDGAAATRISPDGPNETEVRPGEVLVVQARGSGDDAIVDVVRGLPGRVAVVTADRELRRRCAEAGATILGPGWLLGLLRP